jgi:predicted MFS family arabinose efflux permease
MRRPSINLVAALMALGAAGFGILAMSPSMIWPLGAVVGMGAGWGWPGLLYHAVAESHPSTPAAATAVATTGNALGAALGPLGFGLVASRFSFDLAWAASATAMVLAGALMVVAGRLRAE